MPYATFDSLPHALTQGLCSGTLAPYLGPEVLSLCETVPVPSTTLALATFATSLARYAPFAQVLSSTSGVDESS